MDQNISAQTQITNISFKSGFTQIYTTLTPLYKQQISKTVYDIKGSHT